MNTSAVHSIIITCTKTVLCSTTLFTLRLEQLAQSIVSVSHKEVPDRKQDEDVVGVRNFGLVTF